MSTKQTVYATVSPKVRNIFPRKKRNHYMQLVVLVVDTYSCTLALPVGNATPRFDELPGEYFATRVYLTYDGAEHSPRREPKLFSTTNARRKFIADKVNKFNREENRK